MRLRTRIDSKLLPTAWERLIARLLVDLLRLAVELVGAVDRRAGRVRAELLALDRDEMSSGCEDADLVAVEQHVDNGVLGDVVLVHHVNLGYFWLQY